MADAPVVYLTCLNTPCQARRPYTREHLTLTRRGVTLDDQLGWRCVACGCECCTTAISGPIRDFMTAPLTVGPCVHAVTVPAQAARWRVCLECDSTVHRSATEHYARLMAGVR